MAENLTIIIGDKKEKYQSILPQIKALLQAETDLIANLSNIAAALKEQFNHLWTGFYIVRNSELVLGPFQGPIACTRIQKGKGVCGTSWELQQSVVVDNVAKFPGHIACSSLSRSEIVVPVIKNGTVVAVLDIDSEYIATFDTTDKLYLEELAGELAVLF